MKGILYYLSTIFVILIFSCSAESPVKIIRPDDPSIRYTGRINFEHPQIPEIYWPGTQIEINFKGRSVKARLKDERGDNYFNILIDDDSLRYIRLEREDGMYVLAEDLPEGTHSIKLIKRTEWDLGKTWFYGFELTEGELQELPPGNERIIEFFGNSITAGYAIEDLTGGDSPDSIYTNNYTTYGAITARYFKADYYGTLKSGIGVMVSWFPLTMPELYDRLDPSDPYSTWDFSRVQPDLVVVNLFQNDS